PAPMVPTDPAATEAPAQELVTAAETGINSDGWLATEIIGSTLYTSAAEDAESIGDVNDFVLDGNGSVAAVIVGVGGFLGIGQKDVAISWNDLQLTMDADNNPRLVSSVTREQLEAAPEFNREEWLASESTTDDLFFDDGMDPAPMPMDPAPAEPMTPAPADPMAPAPADSMTPADPAPADPMAPADPAAPAGGADAAAPAPADGADAAAP